MISVRWAFKNYDENFSMMKQNDPSWPWDVMHSEYWMRATLTTGQNVNNSNNQSFREPQTRQPNSENWHPTQEIRIKGVYYLC